ncbi:acetylornithine deacetylase/succinyl-diaminopimelate desuccinylase-like protein [Paenibacillus sp. RC73]|uniref:M20 family metallopeptidase n=1 Tax=Paenibacillus sp. RC73 TaxID=3156250 RepID=UPI0038384DF8
MSVSSIDYVYERVLELGSRLIRLHPTYSRPSAQKEAQLLIQQALEQEGWTTYMDVFTVSELRSRDLMRHPWEYNSFYKDGLEMIKHNLYAVADSGRPGPTLILNGHIDVDILNSSADADDLPWNTKGDIVGGKLQGRGATDMLIGLSSLVYALSLCKERFTKGKLIFTSVVDEEIGGNGSIRACEWLKDNGYAPARQEPIEVVIAEPTNTTICTSSLGFLPFKLHIQSRSIHMNAQQHNQIAEIASLLHAINTFKGEHEGLNLNIGIITGGTDPSLPVQDLHMEGVIASDSRYTIRAIKEAFEQAVLTYTVQYPNLVIEPMESHGMKFGKALEQEVFPSSCDASVFQYFGYQTVIFGPGRLAQAHTEDEYIDLDDVKSYIQSLKELLIDFFG